MVNEESRNEETELEHPLLMLGVPSYVRGPLLMLGVPSYVRSPLVMLGVP